MGEGARRAEEGPAEMLPVVFGRTLSRRSATPSPRGEGLLLALLALCACNHSTKEIDATVTIDLSAETQVVPVQFISVGLDMNVLLGGKGWVEGADDAQTLAPLDLTSPKLHRLAASLGPAFLRLGGADADRVFFSADDSTPLPKGDTLRLTAARWDAIADFAQTTNLSLVPTLNAGEGPRDAHGVWTADDAALLVDHATQRLDAIHHWELGFEPNGYQATFGPSFKLDGLEYARDLEAARAMLDAHANGSKLGAAQTTWWPIIGEPAPMTQDLMDATTVTPDVVSWTWYPLESRRCQLQLSHAKEDAFDDAHAFAAFDTASDQLERIRTVDAHDAGLWLGSTGHARCGGEPGLSDRYVASLWWLDLLGRTAARGYQTVVRDSLVGGDDGLLDQTTFDPNPDYWATVLFKKLMNGKVLDTTSSNGRVVAYAQCTRAAVSSVTVLLINPDPQRDAAITLAQISVPSFKVFQVTATDPLERAVQLNGVPLTVGDDGQLPSLEGVTVDSAGGTVSLHLEARSYAFLVVPGVSGAGAGACR